jgi:hypothetical protein
VSPPTEPPDPGDWPPPEDRPQSELDPRPEPLLWKVLRSTIAPDVLSEAGHDAPLSPRGRILFWGTVAVLVLAIAVLFVVTVSK